MQLFADLERIPSARKHIRYAALVNLNVLITDKCLCLMCDLALSASFYYALLEFACTERKWALSMKCTILLFFHLYCKKRTINQCFKLNSIIRNACKFNFLLHFQFSVFLSLNLTDQIFKNVNKTSKEGINFERVSFVCGN